MQADPTQAGPPLRLSQASSLTALSPHQDGPLTRMPALRRLSGKKLPNQQLYNNISILFFH